MSALEVLRTQSVQLTVTLGGKPFNVAYNEQDGVASTLTIIGVGEWDAAKRMLAVLNAGLKTEYNGAAKEPPKTEPEKPAPQPQGPPPETAKPQAAPAPAPPASSQAVPEKLLKAEKLRDVLVYLQEQGIPPQRMVARCLELQPEVPALKRIPNLTERVTRAMEMLGPAA